MEKVKYSLVKYSVVFRPDDVVVEAVAGMKARLRQEIGWYKSANAQAHVTVCEFHASEKELELCKERISKFCAGVRGGKVSFDRLDHFPSTLYIAPDQDSFLFMKAIMARFNKSFPLLKEKTSNHPHLSIGRGLGESQIEKGFALLDGGFAPFSFDCDSLFLRKFDPERGQFAVVGRFWFGNPETETQDEEQLSLF